GRRDGAARPQPRAFRRGAKARDDDGDQRRVLLRAVRARCLAESRARRRGRGALRHRRGDRARSALLRHWAVAGRHGARRLEAVRTVENMRQSGNVRKLARVNRADWSALLQRPAGTLRVRHQPLRKELGELHASALVRKMEKRFPTTAFGAQLEHDKSALPAQRDALLGLLAEHPDFDLAAGNVDLLLKKSPAHAKAKQALKATQRVFKVAP